MVRLSPTLRWARAADLPGMASLIREQAAHGRMLPRSAGELHQALDGFRVVVDPYGGVLACGGLRCYGPGSAEIIGVAVQDHSQGLGLGRRIIDALVGDARARKLDRVFALTLEVAFFRRMGFDVTDFAAIPEKVARDCVACPFRPTCRETPVVMSLVQEAVGRWTPRRTRHRTLVG